ncbi:MAG: DUF1343 domain-containing protein, partial [Fulvivirga sp.]|nr:DUF1343 domain-containing protein [Fulvivirga sp.]
DQYLPMIKNKNVALVVNQTSMVGQAHLVDTLLSLNISIKKVFAPEHGFRGDIDRGKTIKDGMDAKTDLPIVSLYGSSKKPSVAQLKDIDVLIFDIQDVGARFYTYISTMHYVMEAAAENGKKVIVLDRPNPNGMYVDGPVLKMEFQSFVGMHPIPVVHGLTVGELAKMINGEGWLNNGITCNLEVISCEGYKHSDRYSLPVKPSPNLPNDLSIKWYPSICLFEGTVISVGRGTQQPFQQIGHPSFKGMPHRFTPKDMAGMQINPVYEGKVCYGLNLAKEKLKYPFTLKYLIDFYNIYHDREPFFNRENFFNKLAGNDMLLKQIKSGMKEKEIRATWKEDLKAYKQMREKYLLYKE